MHTRCEAIQVAVNWKPIPVAGLVIWGGGNDGDADAPPDPRIDKRVNNSLLPSNFPG